MSTGLYSHTTRGTGTVLTAAIYNADHQNHITNQTPQMTGALSDNVAQMQLSTDPGAIGTETLAPDLAGELERLRFAIKGITGKTQWYVPPAISLESVSLTPTLETLTVTKSIRLSGDLTPAQITANQNNYAPTGHADAFRFRIATDASRNLTGLAGGVAGRVAEIVNIGVQNAVLTNEDAASTAANRFLFGSNVTIRPEQSLLLQYDGTSSRWRPLNTADLDNLTIAGTLSVGGTLSLLGNASLLGYEDLAEIASPASPAANVGRIYVKDVAGVTLPFMKDSAGAETGLIGGLQLLAAGTVAAAATLDIVLTAFAAYKGLLIKLSSFIPVDDAVELWARLSTDGGVGYDATGYRWGMQITTEASSIISGSAADNQLSITSSDISNVAAEGGCNADVTIMDHANTAVRPKVLSSAVWVTDAGATRSSEMGGQRIVAQNTDAVRFLFETGNIASGKYAVYGYA